jgi:hypothetical protein
MFLDSVFNFFKQFTNVCNRLTGFKDIASRTFIQFTTAYQVTDEIYDRKLFIVKAPGANVKKHFTVVIYEFL